MVPGPIGGSERWVASCPQEASVHRVLTRRAGLSSGKCWIPGGPPLPPNRRGPWGRKVPFGEVGWPGHASFSADWGSPAAVRWDDFGGGRAERDPGGDRRPGGGAGAVEWEACGRSGVRASADVGCAGGSGCELQPLLHGAGVLDDEGEGEDGSARVSHGDGGLGGVDGAASPACGDVPASDDRPLDGGGGAL